MSSQEIKALLTQPENIALALEIADYIEEIKQQTHLAFWPMMNNELGRILYSSPFADYWHFVPFSLRRLRKEYEKCWIQPINRRNTKPLLQFGIGQSSPENNYRLYCGVLTSDDTFTPEERPLMTRLKAELNANNLTIVEPQWLGWNYISIIPQTGEFIVGMAANPEAYIQESAQIIWDIFVKLQPHMDALNDIRSQKTD